MQSAALVVGEVVTFVVRNEVDNRPLGQRGRLVQNEPPLFDARSERAHVLLYGFRAPGKRSHGKRSPRLGEAVTLSGSGRRPQRDVLTSRLVVIGHPPL